MNHLRKRVQKSKNDDDNGNDDKNQKKRENERGLDEKENSDSCASLLEDHPLKSSQYYMTCMRHMNAYFGVLDIIVPLTMAQSVEWKV